MIQIVLMFHSVLSSEKCFLASFRMNGYAFPPKETDNDWVFVEHEGD